jgi:hypothetical protein
MKSPEKYSQKEAALRFKKALGGAFALPPMENKNIRVGRAKAKPKKKSSAPAKRAGDASDQ